MLKRKQPKQKAPLLHKMKIMKKRFLENINKKVLRSIVVAGLLLVASPLIGTAQTDSTAQIADSAQQEPELISPSLEFAAVQKSDNSVELKVRLRGKVNGQPINFYKLKVSFFQVVNEEDVPLGFSITDGSGKALFNVTGDSLKTDSEGTLHFKAVFAGNNAMEPAEEVATMKRALLEITPIKEDSLLTVQVKLSDIGLGEATPIKEATIGIFVKRSFLPLKVGEGTTDENGEATIEFPNDLPGDPKGNLTLIARLDENEIYGNLEASSVQNWGVPVSDKIENQPRALWSTHPPMWMLITFIVLMVTVWGHYIVIVYELFRLRKEKPHTSPGATNS